MSGRAPDALSARPRVPAVGLEAAAPPPLELWTGVECTFNRVGETYLNQLEVSGHDRRLSDLDLLASLGARRVRYPVLWEQVAPEGPQAPGPGPGAAVPDWRWTDERLGRLRELGLSPIATLLHHGSGPRHTSLLDPEFPEKLAAYAGQVAARYPWLRAYTPVNEPLTTARFSGLYGVWYPHHSSDASFVRALLYQCRGTVLAMRAIREVQPQAELIQTDDLGKAHATPAMQAEADFQNERRWLAFDLLCGRVDAGHPLRPYLLASGASPEELAWFVDHPCPPDVIGIDYYVTSERFLDERRARYAERHSNATHADVEAVRVSHNLAGIAELLRETWARYHRPVAVTEAHLGGTREEQLRWFETFWQAAEQVRAEGADIRAVTSWAALGSFDWNSLHTAFRGYYEPGAFDVRSVPPRPTALAGLLRERAAGTRPTHPTLASPGFWERPGRFLYPPEGTPPPVVASGRAGRVRPRPLLVLGAGELGQAVARLCGVRGLEHRLLRAPAISLGDHQAARELLDAERPWAVVNAAGYGHIEQAEREGGRWQARAVGLGALARACAARGLGLLSFSSDQVFAGEGLAPYQEHDRPSPINAYGRATLDAERRVLAAHPGALIVRSSALFGTGSAQDPLHQILRSLAAGGTVPVDHAHRFSPTYLPDLVHASLDLLIDGERGLWHLVNRGESTWAELVHALAGAAGLPPQRVRSVAARELGRELGWTAPRPRYSALSSHRAHLLPSLDDALGRSLTDPASGLAGLLR